MTNYNQFFQTRVNQLLPKIGYDYVTTKQIFFTNMNKRIVLIDEKSRQYIDTMYSWVVIYYYLWFTDIYRRKNISAITTIFRWIKISHFPPHKTKLKPFPSNSSYFVKKKIRSLLIFISPLHCYIKSIYIVDILTLVKRVKCVDSLFMNSS